MLKGGSMERLKGGLVEEWPWDRPALPTVLLLTL